MNIADGEDLPPFDLERLSRSDGAVSRITFRWRAPRSLVLVLFHQATSIGPTRIDPQRSANPASGATISVIPESYFMDLVPEVATALETLEALYYFTQGVRGESAEHLEKIRGIYRYLLPSGYPKLISDLERDVRLVHYGADATDEFYRALFREAREADGKGVIYISKLRVLRGLFSRYHNPIVRWPQINYMHSSSSSRRWDYITACSSWTASYFTMRSSCSTRPVRRRAARSHRANSRDAAPSLHTLLRSIVTALFTFVEGYLNGIAFDCFQTHHDELELDDHDFLGEWNSNKKQRRFVKFDDKVFGYPRLISKVKGLPEVDL